MILSLKSEEYVVTMAEQGKDACELSHSVYMFKFLMANLVHSE